MNQTSNFKARIVKGSGGGRRMIEVPKIEYDDFNCGDKVGVTKINGKKNKEEQDR